jgi:hypothetical protein
VKLVLAAIDSGLGLVSIEFRPDLKGDECLLSGFLIALRHISDGIFLLPFDEMRFGKYTMLVRAEPPFLFCYTFSGSTKHSSRRLDQFIEVLQEKASLLDSLRNTILSGEIDRFTQLAIGSLASQVFTLSNRELRRCE